MKNTFKIFALASLLFLSNACTDLEEDTSGILTLDALKSETEIDASLAPIYRQVLNVHMSPHTQRICTFGSDDITTWIAGNKEPLRVFDRFDYGSGENADIRWLDLPWADYWKTIYYCNTLIEGLKTSAAPESVVKIADGEARFIRAMSYFSLVRVHGNMPIILDGDVPTGEETRATVLENYQHIEKDLLIAEASLPGPADVKNQGRASKAAAKTLLADLYLTWAGWPVKDAQKYQQAASKAKEVIDMGYFKLLPIDKLWLLENANSLESIFSIQFSKSEDLRSGYATANSFHESRGFSDMFPELQFFRDFPEGARKEATFATEIPQRGVANGTIYYLTPPTKPWPNSQRKHPMYRKFTISEDLTVGDRTTGFRPVELFRYAEVLLIYAEAQARVGENASSIEAFNQIKRRAAGLPFDVPNATVDVKTATVSEILKEKAWELAGENKRWFDLVRTETLADAIAVRDPKEDVVLVRQPTEKQYIAPIPYIAISTSKLAQNPEGFKIK